MVHKTDIPDVDMDQTVTILYFMFYELRLLTYLKYKKKIVHTQRNKNISLRRSIHSSTSTLPIYMKRNTQHHFTVRTFRQKKTNNGEKLISKQYGE